MVSSMPYLKSPLRLAVALIVAGVLVLAGSAVTSPATYEASADEPVVSATGSGAFDIAIWGDLPYTSAGTGAATPKVPNLIADMNKANLAFTVFLGDTKDGSSVCDNKT